jgi:hypothetical protein
MRVMGLVSAVAALVLAGGVAVNSAGATVTATARTTIRPVTSTGHPAPGFVLHSEPAGSVDCTAKIPSPAAVSPNINFCSPSAEYAVACWKSAVAARALCFRNPLSKDVYRIPRTGAFASTTVAPTQFRAPLLFKIADGDFCAIRDGGALGSLPAHPSLFATYVCVKDGLVWARTTTPHFGIDESHPLWTVITAPAGNHRLVTRHIVRAWFVATKSV